MSKTPEEIKRGLECCLDDREGLAGCINCPYADRCAADTFALERDALAYIRQLEAERMQPTGRERGSATSPSNLERSGNMPGVAATRSEIAGQPTRWISAKTPPEYDKRYIVWDGNQIEVAECWGDGEWANHHFGVMICGVTHYMPLPKVPEEDKQHGL